MTEVPRVRVSPVDLKGEAPVALRDSLTTYELGIDFSWPPEHIAAALTELFQEGVSTERWRRRGTGEHEQPVTVEETRAAPHPES